MKISNHCQVCPHKVDRLLQQFIRNRIFFCSWLLVRITPAHNKMILNFHSTIAIDQTPITPFISILTIIALSKLIKISNQALKQLLYYLLRLIKKISIMDNKVQ